MNIKETISKELNLLPLHVQNVIDLLDDGKTVPFIARYRKEMTGSMDDQMIRKLSERLEQLRNLEKRRDEILKALEERGQLNEDLKRSLLSAPTMTMLEDLYRPYRPKRKTRASAAAEKGLSPLADLIMSAEGRKVEEAAVRFVAPEMGVFSAEEAIKGALDIVAEIISNDAGCRARIRSAFYRTGIVSSKAAKDEDSAYSMYYDFAEPVSRIPGHRILAINRGEREGFLKVSYLMDREMALEIIRAAFIKGRKCAADFMELAAADAWTRLIAPSMEREISDMLTERASTAAIGVFGENLRHLLMQPPIKGRVTLGVDPGFRTGCKLAVVDACGKVLQTGVAYFTLPGMDRKRAEAAQIIRSMVRRHGVTAIAIGNGTASRESEMFIADLLKEMPEDIQYAIVSEAGASVYSASKLGAEEFPDYDVSLRSAVSIARRLQDPLAELVKIDPKSIGVGQYQHDLKEAELNHKLDNVIEDCVNAVGVELTTASASLLTHVAGIGPALAKNIVAYREENGFSSRAELKKVPKLGPKAFEQAAGFLRIADAANALDATAIHPESYAAAKRLIEHLGYKLSDIRGGAPKEIRERAAAIGLSSLAETLDIGEPTLNDILNELVKPGRDPRDDLPPVILRSDVLGIEDLEVGMELQGTVRNVVDFGAFVDIGVHQDGLVHISRMAERFVRHPSEVVKVGDVVKVQVIEVDKKKKRIALSMNYGKKNGDGSAVSALLFFSGSILEILLDFLEKGFAEFAQLDYADTADLAHLFQRGRLFVGHAAQRTVGKDDVRRDSSC